MMTDAMKPLGISLFQLTALRPMFEAGGRLFVDVAQQLASPESRKDLLALMRELRIMGGGNVLQSRKKTPLQRGTLERAEQIYRKRHSVDGSKIGASFEIVYLCGWAPDASQQKPLAPGSAAMRLADALGTVEQLAGDTTPFPARRAPRRSAS